MWRVKSDSGGGGERNYALKNWGHANRKSAMEIQ